MGHPLFYCPINALQNLQGTIEERLVTAGARLLDVVSGDATLTVNRMAMADTCQARQNLGTRVREQWNNHIRRPVTELLIEARSQGLVAFEDEDEAFGHE